MTMPSTSTLVRLVNQIDESFKVLRQSKPTHTPEELGIYILTQLVWKTAHLYNNKLKVEDIKDLTIQVDAPSKTIVSVSMKVDGEEWAPPFDREDIMIIHVAMATLQPLTGVFMGLESLGVGRAGDSSDEGESENDEDPVNDMD